MGQACPWPLWLPKSVIACICVFNRNSQRRWNWSKKSKENIQKQIKAKLELWIEFWKSMQNKRVVQNLVLLLSTWQNVIVCYAFASWMILVTDLTSSYKQCFTGRWIFCKCFLFLSYLLTEVRKLPIYVAKQRRRQRQSSWKWSDRLELQIQYSWLLDMMTPEDYDEKL